MTADRLLIVCFVSDDQEKCPTSFTSDRLIVLIVRNEDLAKGKPSRLRSALHGEDVDFQTIRRSADHFRTVTAGCPDRLHRSVTISRGGAR